MEDIELIRDLIVRNLKALRELKEILRDGDLERHRWTIRRLARRELQDIGFELDNLSDRLEKQHQDSSVRSYYLEHHMY